MALVERISTKDSWVYEVYSKDTPPEELGEYSTFKRLWDSRRQGEALPAWRDFQFEDFIGWHGWISVDELIPGPEYDSIFRLWGTKLTQLYGSDYTNRHFKDLVGEQFPPEEAALLKRLSKTEHFRICYGPIDWYLEEPLRGVRNVGFIELPLADDGSTVDRYMNAAIKRY